MQLRSRQTASHWHQHRAIIPKLRDIATGACTKTLHAGTLRPLAIDATGSYLVTSMGSIALDSYLATNQTPTTARYTTHDQGQPQYHGYGIVAFSRSQRDNCDCVHIEMSPNPGVRD